MKSIFKSRVTAVVGGAVVLVVAAGGSGAYASHLVTSAQIKNNTIQSADIHNGAINRVDLNKSINAALSRTGARGPAGPAGPPGPKGDPGTAGTNGSNGSDALVTVTGSTQITNRNDSGHSGNWATDDMLRSATVTRQHASPSAKCGGADQCYFYTGEFTDNGTFTTLDGANSPNAGKPISGTLSGTVTGVQKFEFYSSDDSPGTVPASSSGNGVSSAQWLGQFFTPGSVFGMNEISYSYDYTGTGTCESWHESNTNNDGQADGAGDITGVNACQGTTN